MTYEEFLDALRQTPRDWFISYGRYVRRPSSSVHVDDNHCPLSAVAGTSPGSVIRSAQVLCIPQHLANEIANAADGLFLTGNKRDDILAACGIQEQQ